jgi:hypothetical protein
MLRILENILILAETGSKLEAWPSCHDCLVAAQLVVASNLQVSEGFGFDKQL